MILHASRIVPRSVSTVKPRVLILQFDAPHFVPEGVFTAQVPGERANLFIPRNCLGNCSAEILIYVHPTEVSGRLFSGYSHFPPIRGTIQRILQPKYAFLANPRKYPDNSSVETRIISYSTELSRELFSESPLFSQSHGTNQRIIPSKLAFHSDPRN